MVYIKNILISIIFVFVCTGSTCVNKTTLDNLIAPSTFIVLDTFVAVQIELGADRCFDEVDGQNLLGEEALQTWNICIQDYRIMDFIIGEVRKNIVDNDMNSFKINVILLANLLEVLNIPIPEEIESIFKQLL